MPVLPTPNYVPPLAFRSGNIATLYPPLFRQTPEASPASERIKTPDGDFLDLDRHRSNLGKTRKITIISHGLEGHARKKYTLGMASAMTRAGFDAACWSQRGCGNGPNRFARSYHSGETNDIHTVIEHCLKNGMYDTVTLIGFSMGGNQILKYLGEAPDRVPAQVKAAATFSVPCDLSATERVIAMPSRRVYFEYFMVGLRAKVKIKADMFPEAVHPERLKGITTLRQFDDRFTAPTHDFTDAEDYYTRSSCNQFLKHIKIPTLLVNAQDDPFLAPECFPIEQANDNPNFFLEMPRYGGHVGFVQTGPKNEYWSESRAVDFLTDQLR